VRRLLVLVAALILTGTASATTSPEQFVARVFQDAYNVRGSRLYDELHPAQSRLINRRLFVACLASRAGAAVQGARVKSAKLVGKTFVTKRIPGTSIRAVATVATVRISVVASGQTYTTTEKNDLYIVKGRWRWVLDDLSVTAYRQHVCPPHG
jgi:hypothetical protein